MSFGSALSGEIANAAKCREDAEKIQRSLPKNPEKGSYYWWAQICREYTGYSYLASGHYGYNYQKNVLLEDAPQEFLVTFNGMPEMISINLPKWLATHLDPTDETAEDIEAVLDWAGEWLHPRANWFDLTQDMGAILEMLYACISEQSTGRLVFHKAWTRRMGDSKMWDVHDYAKVGEVGELRYAEEIVVYYRDKLRFKSDFKDYQWSMEYGDIIERALKELPVKAVKRLYEAGVHKSDDAEYTLHTENDLNQDFHIDIWLQDEYSDLYVIVRTHNGADSRGGFSSPVVAMVGDFDYFGYMKADLYCGNCQEYYSNLTWWEMILEKLGEEWELPVEQWLNDLEIQNQLDAGQLSMFPTDQADFTWKHPEELATVRTILAYMRAEDTDEEKDGWVLDEDKEYPMVILEKGEYALPYCDGYQYIPDEEVHGIFAPSALYTPYTSIHRCTDTKEE